jgi:hypothetical protein
MSDLPDNLNPQIARQIAAAFVELYPAGQDRDVRYEATRHILWQAMAAMISRGVPDETAMQNIVAALMEILVEGLGPSGAALHMRLMADQIEAGPPELRQ